MLQANAFIALFVYVERSDLAGCSSGGATLQDKVPSKQKLHRPRHRFTFSLLVARIPLTTQLNASSALFADVERSDLASFREKMPLQQHHRVAATDFPILANDATQCLKRAVC
jgi:hypothetical protein